MHICFDIDGTLCEVSEDCDFDDNLSILRHTRPKHPALERLLRLKDAGHTISFVTGRGDNVKAATMKQLKLWIGTAAGHDLMMRDFEPYEMMRCIVYKMDALRYLEPDLYVGDLPMDQTAAAAAGVPFMPAEWFSKGFGFEHLLNEDFTPKAIRGYRRSAVDEMRQEVLGVLEYSEKSERSTEAENGASRKQVDSERKEATA